MKKNLIALSILSAAAIAITGCAAPTPAAATPAGTQAPAGNEAPASTEKVTISVNGSTSVEPLMQIFADIYAQANKNTTINIQATGSSAGIKSAIDGSADIGMSSRELKAEEKESLTETIIAKDAIAVIINSANPVQSLTSEQITAIFKGEISNWNQVGGEDKEILIVSREAGSGTRGAFEELLGLVENDKSLIAESKAIFADSTNSVAMNVKDKDNAIGYVSLGSLSKEVKALKVDDIDCTEANVLSGTYKISRPFIIGTKGENPNVKAFIDFMMSAEGQTIVAENKFIKVQ